MLAIGRAYMAQPQLLMLDEPSLGLSPLLTKEIFNIISRIRQETGTAVLVVEQNAAIALAHAAKPAAPAPDQVFQDEHGIALGSEVVIHADAFGTEPSAGQLVAATRTRYTIRRTDPRAGTVHVHFPRLGFILTKAQA